MIFSFAKDVEKATEPFMEKARQIKDEVNIATSDLKQVVDKQNETFLNKTGKGKKLTELFIFVEKLMEAGDKFTREAVQIVRDDEPEVVSLRSRYGLRGPKLFLILASIIMIAILVVVGKKKKNQVLDNNNHFLHVVLFKFSQ